MGCYLSKLPRDTNVFRVYNVNDLGAEISPGKIEVTGSDLILYQKRKEPIRWPLRCLRRYGFDEELFSFESGRRCATGSGIFAFKCRRAEELFNLVQESIQNVGQHGHMRTSQTLINGATTGGRTTSRPTSVIDPHEPSEIMLSGAGRVAVVPNDQHLYMNGSVVPQEEPSGPNYINTGPVRPSQRTDMVDHAAALIDFLHDPPIAPPPPVQDTVNYADLDLPRSTENIPEQVELANGTVYPGSEAGNNLEGAADGDSPELLDIDDDVLNSTDNDVFTDTPDDAPHPMYINLDAEGNIKDKQVSGAIKSEQPKTNSVEPPQVNRRLSIEQNYANIGAFGGSDPSPATPTQAVSNSCSSNRLSNPSELNYIEIDVNKTDNEAAQGAAAFVPTSVLYMAPDSPSKRTESYAMIDIQRTWALSNSARPDTNNEEGRRETRHNSTINP